MFKKHIQKRNFRLRMQDTMSVFCLLSYIIYYVSLLPKMMFVVYLNIHTTQNVI